MNILVLDGHPSPGPASDGPPVAALRAGGLPAGNSNPGDPGGEDRFKRYLGSVADGLGKRGHEVRVIALRDLDIRFCTGCWSCWWGPTPGECVFKDDSHRVCREYINSDFVVFASPMILGFTSALLKKVQDKLIPLLHPYIDIIGGECHHHKRYERYPRIGLLYDPGTDHDPEDVKITTDIYGRFALNFRTSCAFSLSSEVPSEEVCDAVDNL